jgi:hypothetical protein
MTDHASLISTASHDAGVVLELEPGAHRIRSAMNARAITSTT